MCRQCSSFNQFYLLFTLPVADEPVLPEVTELLLVSAVVPVEGEEDRDPLDAAPVVPLVPELLDTRASS